jgi:hypothetical protein
VVADQEAAAGAVVVTDCLPARVALLAEHQQLERAGVEDARDSLFAHLDVPKVLQVQGVAELLPVGAIGGDDARAVCSMPLVYRDAP